MRIRNLQCQRGVAPLRPAYLILLLVPILLSTNPAWARAGAQEPSAAAISAEESRTNCVAHSVEHLAPAEDILPQEIEEFLKLSERTLAYRQNAIEVARRLNTQVELNKPLSGADLELLREGTSDYLTMRQELWRLAAAHECWIDPPKNLSTALDPQQRTDGILMSVGAALLLYDNYLLTAALFDQDSKLRRVLNQPDKGYALQAHRLTAVKRSFLSLGNSARMQKAIAYYQKMVLTDADPAASTARPYLQQLIAQSPSFAALSDGRVPANLKTSVRHLRMLSTDLLAGLSREGLNLFSMFFGNTVGLVETRRGKLYRQSDLEQQLVGQLHAGDVLLEKTPFRLTDLMIPGYWGHAAIWVGNEAELRALGVWEHPAVRPHQEHIREGKGVVEALRGGVVLNSFAHFMNVDDLAVLRPLQLDRQAQAARVVRAFRQLGKAYDFNFDVESTDRIVCSELVYQVYTEMPWPTSKQLGRATISPDQVAQRALPGGPLHVVALVENGLPVENELGNRMRALLAMDAPESQEESESTQPTSE